MANFTVVLYEIAAHSFSVDALNEEAAIRLARAKLDAQMDPDTCVSLGLDLERSPAVSVEISHGEEDLEPTAVSPATKSILS